MHLYLGNHQESVLDLEDDDVIQISPIAKAIGGVYKNTERKAYRPQYWDDNKITYIRFFFRDHESEEATKLAAKKYYDTHNVLHKGIVIDVKAQDLTANHIKLFRYIQSKTHYEFQDIILDPYYVGAWLGDGTSANTSVTNIDEQIIEFLKKFAKTYDMPLVNKDKMRYFIGESQDVSNIVMQKLRKLDLIKNKHIPKCYLQNSVEIRLQVLAGLIDTDGHLAGHNGDGNYFEIVQKSERVAKDIVILANSLGFFTYTCDKEAYASNTEAKTRRNYKRTNIYINRFTPQIPVLIDYKKYDVKKLKPIVGVPMSFTKSNTPFKTQWTQEMRDNLETTMERHKMKTGRTKWAEIAKTEELYKGASLQNL